jgi:hypothetical protein
MILSNPDLFPKNYVVLAGFWESYRYEIDYAPFFDNYYNAGHIAWLVVNEIVTVTSDIIVSMAIEEAYQALMDWFELPYDLELSSYEEMLEASSVEV